MMGGSGPTTPDQSLYGDGYIPGWNAHCGSILLVAIEVVGRMQRDGMDLNTKGVTRIETIPSLPR